MGGSNACGVVYMYLKHSHRYNVLTELPLGGNLRIMCIILGISFLIFTKLHTGNQFWETRDCILTYHLLIRRTRRHISKSFIIIVINRS